MKEETYFKRYLEPIAKFVEETPRSEGTINAEFKNVPGCVVHGMLKELVHLKRIVPTGMWRNVKVQFWAAFPGAHWMNGSCSYMFEKRPAEGWKELLPENVRQREAHLSAQADEVMYYDYWPDFDRVWLPPVRGHTFGKRVEGKYWAWKYKDEPRDYSIVHYLAPLGDTNDDAI